MSQLQFHEEVQQWAELEFVNPPIPVRSMDWRATRPGYEPGDPIGYGPTQHDALADLQAKESDE